MTVPRPSPGPGFPPNGLLPDEWGGPSAPLDLFATAASVGARAWSERRLHALVGAWASDAVRPDAVTAFDRVAMRHGWRSEVLVARLPQLRELPLERVVRYVDVHHDSSLEALALVVGDRERSLAWTSVASSLLEAHRDHLRRCGVVSDAPLRRWLPLVVASLEEDLELLDGLCDPDGDGVVG